MFYFLCLNVVFIGILKWADSFMYWDFKIVSHLERQDTNLLNKTMYYGVGASIWQVP